MIEIIFRGRTAKGKWVYGDLVRIPNGDSFDCDIISDFDERDDVYDLWKYAINVIPETVGRYTGITDKNGKKIFEGDIVKMSFIEEGEEWEPEYLTVYWDDKVNGFLCHSNQTTMSVESDLLCDGEVVGNIHDNPELVEVEACRM